MQKGRFLLTSVVSLSVAIIISTCVGASSAPQTPVNQDVFPGISAFATGDLSLPGERRYIGMERPDWLFERMAQIRTQQGSGPIPDLNLTPTATASHELYANSAPYGELNRIVISSDGVDENGDGRFDPGVRGEHYNLWLLCVDGTFATQLTSTPADDLYPAYDPGGRLVAFSSNITGVWQIYTIEILTRTIRQITHGPGNKYEPTWSPDGNWIAFSGDAAGTRDLYIVPSDGRLAPERITDTPDNDTQPRWAPSAAIHLPILFTRSGTGMGSRIYRTNSAGDDVEQVTNGGGDPAANDTDPAWRHDVQLIAFASDRLTDPLDTSRDYNIWTVAPVGEDAVEARLRSNLDPAAATDDRYPTFNPGLTPRQPIRIFFSSWRAGNQPDIWRLEVDDPVPPELLDLPTVHARTGGPDANWPWTEAPRRYINPGAEVMISVPVFDRDSGVAQVIAEIKDPDRKNFSPISTTFFRNHSGTAAREIEPDIVARFELFDDGDSEHGDREAGDGVFSGTWDTPTIPADYIISITATDVAGNSMRYDNIYGFTTRVFEPRTNALFVNDYCEGQAFISAMAPAGRSSLWDSAFPVESYWTRNPGGFDAAANVAFDTFRDLGRYRDGIYLGEDYDTWRVICRGPITITDLIYYLPTRETQLTVPDLADTREVLVADRAVVWAAPRTGSLWMGPGALVDATTQATLATFLDRGGRLFISGQDIGWALTLDGRQQNAFYNNYLHARFVHEKAPGNTGPGSWWPTISGSSDDPVVAHTFTVYDDEPDQLQTGWHTIGTTHYPQDCSHNIRWEDIIEPLGGAVQTHTYTGGGGAGLRYQDPTGYRVVYFAWGFEQTHRYYRSVGTNWRGQDAQGECGNYRAKTLHNVLCWLRTGGFQGRVLSISDGMRPITDPTPIVRVYRGGQMVAAVQCEEDGRYVVGGIPPGTYTFTAHRPGYEIDHPVFSTVHGGLAYPTIDFAITRAEPGAIRGRVTSEATGEPLATVEVCAYYTVAPEPEPEEPNGDDPDNLGPAQIDDDPALPERGERIACTTTDADGTYVLSNIPIGNVIVEADGRIIGYGTDEALVEVTSGNTSTVDLALPAAPGTLEVTVTDRRQDDPLEGAIVEVLREGSVVDDLRTDADGVATFELAPGDYTVEAMAPGYERSAPVPVRIAAGETETLTIALDSQPPGRVAGLISRGGTGEPVGGIRVDLMVGTTVIDTTTSTDTTSTAPDGSRYNYDFDDAPTGRVTIQPAPVGFTVNPEQRTVDVITGEWTTAVNFTLTSIRRFPAGLQLISLPWDYPRDDPAELLGVDRADFKMAAWDARSGLYARYPSAPADRFRLGTGYWLKLDEPRELTRDGIEPGDVHEVQLRAGRSGWNLLGGFFRRPLDFYSLTVVTPTGVEYNMQQAMSAGLVRSPLFAYLMGGYTTSAVADAYVGYWINVGSDVTIIGNRLTDTLAVDEQPARAAVVSPEGGWLMPLVVECGEMRDASTWVGCAPAATSGFDAGLDMLKPPPPGMASGVYAAVEGPEGAQAVSVRPMGEETEWAVVVQAPAGEKVRVRWPEMSSIPHDVRPMLRDETSGREVYMRTSTGYEFTAGEGARRLGIRLLEDGGVLSVSAPTAVAAGAGAEISYTLSADATVDVRVMNIAGRVVGSVVEGAVQSAGMQRVTWSGMTTRGTQAPGGVYLVVVRARTYDGQQTEAIGTVTVGR